MIRLEHSNAVTFAARPAFPVSAALICTLGLTCLAGCTATGGAAFDTRPIATGAMRTHANASAAEVLIEGPATDGDDQIWLADKFVLLTGNEAHRLCEVAQVSSRQGDISTAYAALILATNYAPGGDSQEVWTEYARLIGQAPLGAAVALGEALPSDIANRELQTGLIDSACSVAIGAAIERATLSQLAAEQEFQDAQGWLDDDEDRIAHARMLCEAARALNRVAPDSCLTLRADQLLTSTKSDLWESQRTAVSRVFAEDLAIWRGVIESARARAVEVLGSVPYSMNVPGVGAEPAGR